MYFKRETKREIRRIYGGGGAMAMELLIRRILEREFLGGERK